jgi:hypothetical protein
LAGIAAVVVLRAAAEGIGVRRAEAHEGFRAWGGSAVLVEAGIFCSLRLHTSVLRVVCMNVAP